MIGLIAILVVTVALAFAPGEYHHAGNVSARHQAHRPLSQPQAKALVEPTPASPVADVGNRGATRS